MRGGAASRQRRFDGLLRSIGREGEITSLARESAYSLGRLLTFLTHAANERKEDKLLKARIRTAARDVQSLTDHVSFLSGKIAFLLDATLGLCHVVRKSDDLELEGGSTCLMAVSLMMTGLGLSAEARAAQLKLSQQIA
jgi:Mg2+ and Co2+ transporter CorA